MKYLEQPHLISRILTLEEFEIMRSTKSSLKIMMGQTYDKTGGQPIELLAYSLFIMNLEDLLKQEGIETASKILIADHFLTEINREMTEEDAKYHGYMRRDFLSKINQLYCGTISFEFSSSVKETDDYQLALLMLKDKFKNDSKFANLIKETVPKDKRHLPNVFQYPLEELTSIVSLGTDIKIGPPYELYYDNIAREYAQKLGLKKYVAMHLTKSLPLGNPPVRLSELPDGVLPYRFGSKGLEDYRIDLGNLDFKKVEKLINATNNPLILINLIITADLARQRLLKDIKPLKLQPYITESTQKLKEMAKGYFISYIANIF